MLAAVQISAEIMFILSVTGVCICEKSETATSLVTHSLLSVAQVGVEPTFHT
jgi:hypothetical protein